MFNDTISKSKQIVNGDFRIRVEISSLLISFNFWLNTEFLTMEEADSTLCEKLQISNYTRKFGNTERVPYHDRENVQYYMHPD